MGGCFVFFKLGGLGDGGIDGEEMWSITGDNGEIESFTYISFWLGYCCGEDASVGNCCWVF